MKFLDNLCSEDDEIVDKVVYNKYWYLLRISCLYPKLNTHKWRALSVFLFILYLSCLLYHAVLFIISATKLTDDKMEMFQSLHYLTTDFIDTYTLILLNKNRKRFAEVHRVIGIGLSNYDEETDILRKTLGTKIQKKKKLLMQLLLSYLIGISFIIILLEKYLNSHSGDDKVVLLSPNLPITLWVPYDTNNIIGSSTAFLLIAFHCFIIVLVASTFDFTLFVMCENLAMELRLLIHSLNRLPERTLHLYRLHHEDTNISVETMKSNKNLSNCYRHCLKQNIIHHQNIIKNFYTYREHIGLVLWLNITMFAFITAMSGVVVIKSEGKLGSRLVSALFCLGEIPLCYFFCRCCSQITDASEDLILTLYSAKWMSMNKNENQMIKIMMLRSKIPLVMNYRKITNFDYTTFTTMMNTAYSYFNLLLAF